ncbi:MAG: hypothetical protein ACRC3G_06845 [Bacteroidales bacterium]
MKKNILNVKVALCALMMAAVAITSCNKDDDNADNYAQASGMTAELQGYLGKDTTAIDAAMKAKGYTVRHSHDSYKSSSRTYYSSLATEKKSYYFSFESEYNYQTGDYKITGGVESADYGVESRANNRRDAYISQFEAWADECAALKFEDSYSSNLRVLPGVELAKYDSNKRDEFKTAYNANKASLCQAYENWGKSTALLDQDAYCDVNVENGNYSVSVSVSKETKSSNSRSAASRKARIKSLRNSKGQTK